MSSNVVPIDELNASQRARMAEYHEGVPALVTGLCLLGYRTDAELARALGVALGTFKLWKRRVKDVEVAIWTGATGATAMVAQALFKRATGYDVVVKEIRWTKGEAHQVTRTEHVPPDAKAAVAFLGLCGVTPDRPLPGLAPMVEQKGGGKPEVDTDDFGLLLQQRLEGILNRAADAAEEADRARQLDETETDPEGDIVD